MSLSFLYRWANAFWIFDFFTFLKCPIPQILSNLLILVFFCECWGPGASSGLGPPARRIRNEPN